MIWWADESPRLIDLVRGVGGDRIESGIQLRPDTVEVGLKPAEHRFGVVSVESISEQGISPVSSSIVIQPGAPRE